MSFRQNLCVNKDKYLNKSIGYNIDVFGVLLLRIKLYKNKKITDVNYKLWTIY